MNAFTKVLAQEEVNGKIKNVFSFGDSTVERKALFTVVKSVAPKILCKSIKFIEAPDVKVLKNQISIINHNIDSMVAHPNDIDLVMTAGS